MIDAGSVDGIDQTVEPRLDGRPPYIVFDLAKVDYVSSTGWGLFAKYHQAVAGWGGTMALCGMSPELNEIFSCLEFYSFIPSFNTLQEALDARPAGDPEHPDVDAPRATAAPPENVVVTGESIPVDDDDLISEDILDLGEVAEPETPDTNVRRRWTEPEPGTKPAFDRRSQKPRAEDRAQPPSDEQTDDTQQDWGSGERRELPDDQRRPGFGDGFVDVSDGVHSVDVDGSTTDDRVDEDERIRKLGWGEYGDRLKSSIDKKRKKNKKKKDGQ
jgi:anti-anti-sigma factor